MAGKAKRGDVLLRMWEEGQKLYKYQEKSLHKYLVKKCDTLCSWIVRVRDEGKPCVTWRLDVCDKKKRTFKNSQCCHGLRRGYWSHRFDLRNMYSGCANCNGYGYKDHDQGVTTHIIRKHGLEVWDEMLETMSKKKPTIDELIQRKKELQHIRDKVLQASKKPGKLNESN